jgi:hypothetical protein
VSDDSWIVETIIAMRGGIPEKCDFCGRAFTDANYATPEEAGDWACIECVTRWDKEYADMQQSRNKPPPNPSDSTA